MEDNGEVERWLQGRRPINSAASKKGSRFWKSADRCATVLSRFNTLVYHFVEFTLKIDSKKTIFSSD